MAKSLEIIGHVTNCCKRPIKTSLLFEKIFSFATVVKNFLSRANAKKNIYGCFSGLKITSEFIL